MSTPAPVPSPLTRLCPAVSWRGPDGRGVPLGRWVAIALALWLVAWLFAPWEPGLLLAPPFLLVAALWPALVPLGERLYGGKRARLIEWAVALLVLLIVLACFYARPLIKKSLPIDAADHQVMMMRAQMFAESLRHGRIDRWTHLLQGGDSLTDLYPFFFDLIVAVASLVSPFPLVGTYTAVVVLVIFGRGVAVYGLCRRFSGRTISLALAAASMVDNGATLWDGGTEGTVFWGLVHSHLALSLALWSVGISIDLMRDTRGRKVALCAVAAALAAFAHPFGLLALSVWLVALVVTTVLERRPEARRAAAWATAAVLLGMMLGAVHNLPASAALSEHGFRAGLPGFDYVGLGSPLLKGAEPGSSYGMFVGFALVAVIGAAVSHEAPLLSTALATLFCFAFWLTPLTTQLRVYDLMPSLLLGQPRRMAPLLKTLCLPAMAWLLTRAFAANEKAGGSSTRVPAVLWRGLLLLLIGLGPLRLAVVGLDEMVHQLGRGLERPPTEKIQNTRVAADQTATFDFLIAARKADHNPNPWRAALYLTRYGRHSVWKEVLRTGIPLVDFSWIPGNFLTYRPREISALGLRDWAIRYLVTDSPVKPFPEATQRFQSGSLWVWETSSYDGRIVVGPPGVVIDGVSYGPDSIRFKVTGAGPAGATVQVRSAWFPRWRARNNGATVPVEARLPRPDAKPLQQQIALRVHDGEVVLTCDGPIPNGRLGALVSLLGLAGLFYVARARRRDQIERVMRGLRQRLRVHTSDLRRRLTALPKRRRLAVGAAAIAILVLGGVTLRLRGATRLRTSPWEGMGFTAYLREGAKRTRCLPTLWRGQARCDRQTYIDYFLGVTRVGDQTQEYARLWPGIRVTTPRAGTVLELTWPDMKLRGRTLEMRVWNNGSFKASFWAGDVAIATRRWDLDMHERLPIPANAPREGTLTIRLEALSTGGGVVFDGGLMAPGSQIWGHEADPVGPPLTVAAPAPIGSAP